MSRVLVTGATGFIGRHALEPLLAAGHEVHALSTRAGAPPETPYGAIWHEGNLLEDPSAIVHSVRPERLLHLAWYVEHGRFWNAPENVRWVEASLALLRAFAAAGGQRAVLAGTCAEYDWDSGEPRFREDAALRPANLYAASKRGLHQVAAAWAEQAGFELAWGRLFFLHGPAEDSRRLVASVAGALTRGERAPTGEGTARRDFLHSADAGGAFAALIDSNVTGAVNVASGEGPTVRDVVETIARVVGRPDLLDVGALPPRPGEPEAIVADVGRLRDEVGFCPSMGLEEGLAATVAWWRDRA